MGRLSIPVEVIKWLTDTAGFLVTDGDTKDCLMHALMKAVCPFTVKWEYGLWTFSIKS